MQRKFSLKNDRWIKPYLKKYRGSLCLALFLGLAMFFCGGALMFYAGYTIDKAARHPENVFMIYVPIVLMRAVGIGRPLFRYLERLVSHNWILRVTSSLRLHLYQIVAKNTSAAGGEYQTGKLLSLLTEDIGHLQNLYLRTIFPAIMGYLVSTLVIILLGLFSLPLAGLILVLMLVELLLVPLVSLLKEAALRTKEKAEKAQLYTEFTDQVLGEADWQISGRQNDFRERTATTSTSLGRHFAQSARFDRRRDFALEFVFGLMAIALLYFTNRSLTYNQEAANYVGAVVLALFPLSDAIIPVSQGVEEWHTYSDSIIRLNNMKISPRHLPKQKRLDPADFSNLSISHLHFTYPGEEQAIVSDFSLDLKRGEKAALLGPSGSGKSTILQLIMGDLAANQGRVEINGIDIRRLQKQRSKLFSVLNQEPFLFNATIYENLKMAQTDASPADMMRVLEEVQLADLIHSLPKGLDTPIAEAGSRLSGGQKERLALARVLLQDAPIVLLDEPTAGLDPLTEKKLLRLLFRVLKNKTVIWITHNLQGIGFVQKVIFFKNGKIEMAGAPKELYRDNSHFRALYEMDRGISPREKQKA